MSTTLLHGFLLLLAASSSFHLVDSSDTSDAAQAPMCGDEKYQSPLDIAPSSTVYAAEYAGLKFRGYDTSPDLILANAGRSVKVSPLSYGQSIGIRDSGLDFHYLQHFHFHWGTEEAVGSEHKIGGKAYSMEVHALHYDPNYDDVSDGVNITGGVAVLSVLVEIGDEDNTAFSKLVSHFSEIENEGENVTITDTFSLDSILPSSKEVYYRYTGNCRSACDRIVNWTIFREPITISASQMREFRKLAEKNKGMQNNYRTTVSLDGRTVYRSYEELETTTATGAGIFPCSTFVLLYSTIFVYVATLLAT